MQYDRKKAAAATRNRDLVAAVFAGFATPALVDRITYEATTYGDSDMTETRAQRMALAAAIHGTPTIYDPDFDSEL